MSEIHENSDRSNRLRDCRVHFPKMTQSSNKNKQNGVKFFNSSKMLYFIGLGLGDAKDITVKGLEIVKKAKRVYLEHYTSILSCGKEELEAFYERNDIILANRDMVEIEADQILDGAQEEDVAFLVVGDPFGATTHSDLMLRAKERQIPTKVVHNASIMNAVGKFKIEVI